MTVNHALILLAVLAVPLISVWVLIDAIRHRIPIFGESYTPVTGPIVWFLSCLMLCFIVLPLYVVKRKKVTARRRRRAEAAAQFERSISESPEIDLNDPALEGRDPWDLVAIARCQRLEGYESVYLAPKILPRLLHQAQRDYLRLEPGELLLAIVDPNKGAFRGLAFALTTRKIHWWRPAWKKKPAEHAGEGRDPGAGMAGFGLAFRGFSLPYSALGGIFATGGQSLRNESQSAEQAGTATALADPAALQPNVTATARPPAAKATFKVLHLGDGLKINLHSLDPGLRGLLRDFLEAVGPAARQKRPFLTTAMVERGKSILPQLSRQIEDLVVEQQGMRDFLSALKTATRRVLVTPALVLACVAVFVLMVARGVSPMEPKIEDLVDWGANFGPLVSVERESWRLFTSMFLHIGFVHLLFNMWCLITAGPLVERLFGNLAFALIYLFSGLGGALASTATHPLLVSAGASGAIFGIFGALVAFLLVQHQAVPATMLKTLRGSAASFIAYNIFLGLRSAQIDNAAHLGGLATGFVCGLFLHRRLPIVPGARGVARRLAGTVALTLGLIVIGSAIMDRVVRDPQVRSASGYHRAQAYNHMMKALAAPIKSYDQACKELNRLLPSYQMQPERDLPIVNRLITQVSSSLDDANKVTVGDPELQPIRDTLVTCLVDLRDALEALRKLLARHSAGNEPSPIHQFNRKLESSNRAAEQFVALRDKFFKDHGLVLENPPTPNSSTPPQKPAQSHRLQR